MRQSKAQQRAEQVQRLTQALIYYREHPPKDSTRPALQAIARRFWVHPQSFEYAVKMMAKEENLTQ